MSETSTPAVLAAVQGMAQSLAELGIGKDGWNEQQKFHFRGIDAVHDTFAPLLAKHKLFITPHVRERTVELRTRTGKDDLRFVIVKVDYTLRSTIDGSTLEAGPFYGEAMDSGDKATNKAMSIAYKYFAIETFSIPVVGTEGDPDADGNGLSNDRVVELEKGFAAARTKDDLRALVEAAMAEAKAAGDAYAHKRFVSKGAELAAKLVDSPRAKSETPAENPVEPDPAEPSKPAKPAAKAEAPSKGLIDSIRNVGKTKGLETDDMILAIHEAGGSVKRIEDLTKAGAAALLSALGKL